MNNISFNELIKNFNQNKWKFSYLLPEEVNEVLNFPIKNDENKIIAFNNHHFELNHCYLVVLKYSPDFDYSIEKTFLYAINHYFPSLRIETFCCNYKYAAMLSGLGQFAKNSLLYNKDFGFDHHIGVFEIFSELIDLPNRNKANYDLLDLCNNCEDCVKACPTSAIHFTKLPWIDTEKCDNFCHFNNTKNIPSLKEGWYADNLQKKYSFLTQEDIYSITNFSHLAKFNAHIPQEKMIGGKMYIVHYPVCRECTSQKKCSKYKGKYPYNKETKYIPIDEVVTNNENNIV